MQPGPDHLVATAAEPAPVGAIATGKSLRHLSILLVQIEQVTNVLAIRPASPTLSRVCSPGALTEPIGEVRFVR
jgi:hypothetical protein